MLISLSGIKMPHMKGKPILCHRQKARGPGRWPHKLSPVLGATSLGNLAVPVGYGRMGKEGTWIKIIAPARSPAYWQTPVRYITCLKTSFPLKSKVAHPCRSSNKAAGSQLATRATSSSNLSSTASRTSWLMRPGPLVSLKSCTTNPQLRDGDPP